MAAATWKVEVDWSNDGDFSDTGEDVTARVLNDPGIVTVRGRDQIRALAPPMAGRCEFALNNASQDYSPDYASGPLYGKLVPGRRVRVRTTAPSAATLWAGHLDDLPQEPFVRGGGRVRVPALGRLAKLKGMRVSTQVHTTVPTSTAFTYVCAAAGLTSDEYAVLDTGQTTFAHWWCHDDDAFAMLARILAAEGPGAAIYEQADGRIAFHSRHYRLLASRSATSQATLGNASTEPKHSPPFGYEPNLKGVVNSATITAATLTRDAAPTADAWTWAGALVLPYGQALVWTFDLANPADTVLPVVTATNQIGTAESLTPSFGQRFTYTYSNENADGSAQVVTGIAASAYYYRTAEEAVVNRLDTSASQAKYGVRALPASFNPWPYLSTEQARDLADAAVLAYREPRATVSITVRNANSTRLTQQLTREVSDRITVQESQTGIGGDVFIERIEHRVTAGGRAHATTFGCELVNAATDDWFIFDVDNFDDETFGF
jgi:hypothetical protein